MEQSSAAADPRHPIGPFQPPAALDPGERERLIAQIEALPSQLRAALAGLGDTQIDTPYRDGGWTVRQVIHHLADSHMNSFVRFKLALTEEAPRIAAYKEAMWAETADSRDFPIDSSMGILEGLHRRWVALLKTMSGSDFERTFTHPERGQMRLDVNLALYAWHGRHHTAHITGLRDRMGWK